MDLLGGYDSDDASQDEQENILTSAKQGSSKHRGSAPSTGTATGPATAATSKPRRPSQKGKKLLKLQAVLPQHIWNQLVQEEASEDDEDDNDDEDKDMKQSKAKVGSAKGKPASQSAHTEQKQDLLGLLQALPKSKIPASAKMAPLASSSVLQKDSNSGDEQEEDEDHDNVKTNSVAAHASGLGAAFLTSTVQVTRTKAGKKDTNVVRSIHDEVSSSKTTATNLAAEETHVAAAPLRRPAPRVASLPRPAAPAPMRRPVPPPPMPSTTTAPYAAAMPHYPLPPDQVPLQATSAAGSSKRSKSRKRQVEALLRAGNLDAVSSDVQLEAGPNVYQGPSDAGALAAAQYQSHGVRVVPTSAYNVQTGGMTASTHITGKQRGKNQLNALLANAASLEANRLQNPTANAGKIHRANAKRKYGW